MRKNQFFPRWMIAVLTAAIMLSLLPGCAKTAEAAQEIKDMTTGIDVARYQGTIDWKQVADAGVQFAMIRVGYRSIVDGIITEDVNARYNLQEAAKYDIPIGVYFFSTAVNEEEAKEEAAWTADIISGYPITYPVVYDCENFDDPKSRQYPMTREERTTVALTFLEIVESLGYQPMFYGSKNHLQFENAWETSRIEKKYKIWVAQYPQIPYPETAQSSYAGEHHMWQYDTNGTIPGISQPVDLNVAYFGFDGITPRRDKKAPEEAFPSIEAMMSFQDVNEEVTAKSETNLRDIPSQDEDSKVVMTLQNGQIAQRIAICPSGWSKLIFEGETYYAVSSYLTTDLDYDPSQAAGASEEDDGIQTEFAAVNQSVTAKDVVNLRALPSVEHEDARVIAQLKHGEVAQCVGLSDNGWAKLKYDGQVCYAVSSYLERMDVSAGETEQTEAPAQSASPNTIQTQFEPMNDKVTAKVEVNLRSLPSVEDPSCVIVATLYHGDVANRTGINKDVGWSRVEYNGQILYCVSSYLTAAE